MHTILQTDHYQITLIGDLEDSEEKPVFWIPCFLGEGENIWEKRTKPCVLACVSGMDWNRDLSPWKAEKVFAKGDDFGGMGEAFLSVLEERLIPMGESRLAFSVRRRGIAGYSLAGLFAVYAMGRSDRFSLVGSMSGSLWFDGFLEYALETPISPAVKRLYLSLGDKEKKSRNLRMAQVEACTEKLAEIWGKETAVRYEKNPGNHFQDPQGRMAKGLDWLSEGCA